MLQAEKDAAQIDVEMEVEAFLRLVDDLLEADDPGVVHGAVESTEAADGFGDHCFDIGFTADIGGDEEALGAGSADHIQRLESPRLVVIRHRNLRAFTRKRERRDPTKPSRRSRDQHNLAIETSHVPPPEIHCSKLPQ